YPSSNISVLNINTFFFFQAEDGIRDLEPEADQQQAESDRDQRVARSRRGGGRDPVKVGRAGRAVDQRDAIEQKARREGTEQEVLHRRLARRQALLEEAGHDVERERHEL